MCVSQVSIDGRQVDFSTSSELSDPVFGANINGNDILLQVRMIPDAVAQTELQGQNYKARQEQAMGDKRGC